jgi:hypothetical protein
MHSLNTLGTLGAVGTRVNDNTKMLSMVTRHCFSPSINTAYCFLFFIHERFALSIRHQQNSNVTPSLAHFVDEKMRCSNSLCVGNSFWSNNGTSVQQHSWVKLIHYYSFCARKFWTFRDRKPLISNFHSNTYCI